MEIVDRINKFIGEQIEDVSGIKAGSIIKDRHGDEWTVLSTDNKGAIVKANDDTGDKYFLTWEHLKYYGQEVVQESTDDLNTKVLSWLLHAKPKDKKSFDIGTTNGDDVTKLAKELQKLGHYTHISSGQLSVEKKG